jgi:N-acetylmuramoyl-L-alanine amidase
MKKGGMRMKKLSTFVIAAAMCLALPFQAAAAKIVIDPGHGGSDPGAKGVNGIYETTVNHDIAQKLREELLQRGYEVAMTKEDPGVFISLQDRVEITKAAGADLFVSVHANAYPASSAVKGTLILYYDNMYPQSSYPASAEMGALTPESKKLAQSILDHLVAAAGTVNKGLVPSAAYVVRMGNIPSVLVETAFLTNWEDATRLADDRARATIATGIANGIEAYFPSLFPDLAKHWAQDAVLRIRDRGIIQGENNRYYPDRALTRAEFMTMISRMFDLSKLPSTASLGSSGSSSVTEATYGGNEAGSATKSFVDMKPSHWAVAVMNQAVQLGIIQGYEDNTLRPDRAISRGEVAAIFNRLLSWTENGDRGKEDTGYPANKLGYLYFHDVPYKLWSAQSINRLYELGFIEGTAPGQYAPDRGMTRAEIAAVIDRYYSKQPSSGEQK